MESEDLDYHLQQHEDHHHQHVGVVPSSSSSSDTHGVQESNHHSWTPDTILSSGRGSFSNISSETPERSRISSQRNEIIIPDPSFNWPMTQHMESNWTNSRVPEVKQELSLSNQGFPKFTDLLNCPSSIEYLHLGPSNYMKKKNDDDDDDEDDQQQGGNEYLSELSQKLMLKTLSSSSSHMMMMYGSGGSQWPQVGDDYGRSRGVATSSSSRGYHISQIIHPSINISTLNDNGLLPSPGGIKSTSPFDFVYPSRPTSPDGLSLIVRDTIPHNFHTHDYSRDGMSALSDSKTSEAKRPNSSNMDPNGPLHPLKKTRMKSTASCPPIKVRKEKLGERIAALQQLVAPFGKTDTASVLMEAIGYIKFLQNQVQALSVPYMKHSRSDATNRSNHPVPKDDGNEKPNQDLRSRGLCLVPLSCMSYMTNAGSGSVGGGVWPLPNFTQGT